MRVMVVHNYYQQRSPSGENACFEAEVALLRRFHVEVLPYTRANTEIDGYNLLQRVLQGPGAAWSWRSWRDVTRAIGAGEPQVAHFQNTFPLVSPSALWACHLSGVPIVLSLHNYRLLCANALFFRNDHVCEDCLTKRVPWPGVFHRCYRGSRAATSAVATMLLVHRLLRTWQRTVDTFIALTDFARRKFIEGGLPADRIAVKPNFVHPDPGPGAHEGGFALFAGRLSPEKGVRTLFGAWNRLGREIPLKIAGDGPLASEVARACERSPQVEWLGAQPLDRMHSLMGAAAVVIVPSGCYETFGRVIVEAYAKGTPVIASNLGALAELVEDGRTGLRFRPGDPEDLAAKVAWAWTHPKQMEKMGKEARREYEQKYTAERNYKMLMEIYERAIEAARGKRGRKRGRRKRGRILQ